MQFYICYDSSREAPKKHWFTRSGTIADELRVHGPLKSHPQALRICQKLNRGNVSKEAALADPETHFPTKPLGPKV